EAGLRGLEPAFGEKERLGTVDLALAVAYVICAHVEHQRQRENDRADQEQHHGGGDHAATARRAALAERRWRRCVHAGTCGRAGAQKLRSATTVRVWVAGADGGVTVRLSSTKRRALVLAVVA